MLSVAAEFESKAVFSLDGECEVLIASKILLHSVGGRVVVYFSFSLVFALARG